MKRIAKNLTLAAAVFAAGLVIVEVILRTTHLAGARIAWTEPDELISWRFTPGREYWFFNENDHPITGRINSLGWRDRERELDKPEGTLRVAVLGDSFVEAFQVELDSTFCAIAEREISARLERAVEVLNFGRSGMTTTEELLLLRHEVFDYAPDLVVLAFAPLNDIADVNPRTTFNPSRPFYRTDANGRLVLDTSFADSRSFKARKRINTLKQHSALVSLLAERYNMIRLRRRGGTQRKGGRSIVGHLTLCTSSPDSVYAANYEFNKRLIKEVAMSCEHRSVPLILLLIQNVYLPDEIVAYRKMDSSFDPDFFERDLSRWCEREGIGFLGVQKLFRSIYNRNGKPLTWAHWNYAGHRAVAQELVQTVKSK